jgi:hypothetical protein
MCHLSIVQFPTRTARMFVHFAQCSPSRPMLQCRHVGVTIWGQTHYTCSNERPATETRRSCKVNWGAGFAAFPLFILTSFLVPPFPLSSGARHPSKVAGSPTLYSSSSRKLNKANHIEKRTKPAKVSSAFCFSLYGLLCTLSVRHLLMLA